MLTISNAVIDFEFCSVVQKMWDLIFQFLTYIYTSIQIYNSYFKPRSSTDQFFLGTFSFADEFQQKSHFLHFLSKLLHSH